MLPSGRTPSEHVTYVPVHDVPLHWRGFTKALDAGERDAARIIRLISYLYQIEGKRL